MNLKTDQQRTPLRERDPEEKAKLLYQFLRTQTEQVHIIQYQPLHIKMSRIIAVMMKILKPS